MLKELLFYDIEVFRYDWLVVFKNRAGETVGIFHNDNAGIYDLIKDKVLVGYNNHWYDDYILTAILNGWSNHQIKELNDRIISGEKQRRIHPVIESLDCFQEIDVSKPSLKKIEGNLGMSIIESDIDFNIDRPLTAEELAETILYCSYDVTATIKVYDLREMDYFEPKESLMQLLPEGQRVKAKRWNTTTISANILTKRPFPKWAEVRLGETDGNGDYKILEVTPVEVVEFWVRNQEGKGTYRHTEFGCNIDFAFGGLHGVPVHCKKRYTHVKLLDVASLYPNICMALTAFNTATEVYSGIVAKRLKVKHVDKVLSGALKLVINKCYGLLNNEYSTLYNPKASRSVCYYGQIILYDLCKRLAECSTIVNINTDGVAFITDDDHYKTIWEQWESDYGFTLEEDQYSTFIQKDVNNYIAVSQDGIKCKGADVGRYGEDTPFKNNNTRIVDIAVVDFLIHGVPVLDTILKNMDNPRLFQFILKAGNTYQGTFDKEGRQYQKVNRVFASKGEGVQLEKKRVDGGLVKFADTPFSMLVYNGNLDDMDLTEFRDKLDINFYYQLIIKVLKRWQ